ncbi:MAG: T9SS type A sorting domain-containing protein [Candidatus Cloacimonadales bacterium]
MEGSEISAPQHDALSEYLGYERFSQGAEYAIEYYEGKYGTLGAGFQLQYLYQTMADYMIDTLNPTSGALFLNSQDGRTRGVINITENYRTLTLAGFLGAIVDSDEVNNKANLVALYLDFLLQRVADLFPPTNLEMNIENGVLTWQEPDFLEHLAGFGGYRLYLNDEVVAENLLDPAYYFQDLQVGEDYTVGVQAIYEAGESVIMSSSFTFSGVSAENDLELDNFSLSNYPNPFNPSTTISFTLPHSGYAELSIYDAKGRKVKTLFQAQVEADQLQNLVWDGRDAQNQAVAAGIYYYRLSSGKYSQSRKMILLK